MEATAAAGLETFAGAAVDDRAIRAAEQRALQATQREIRNLARRDREVRAHEQAHASVGGRYASAPRYEFERGPNGVSYAVSGSVSIDVSPVPGDPAATLQKMETVRRAALAVAQPSAADRAVARQASAQAAEARAELAREEPLAQSDNRAERAPALDTGGAYIDIRV